MWSFFTVLFGGTFWLLKTLDYKQREEEMKKENEAHEEKYEALYTYEGRRCKLHRIVESSTCSIEHFKKLCEPIDEDLKIIFGDVDYAEMFMSWPAAAVMYIPYLLESKEGRLYSFFSLPDQQFPGYHYKKHWRHIDDTTSYKDRVYLRFFKRVEENIREFQPDFRFVHVKKDSLSFDTVGLRWRFVTERIHQDQYRRLWDDEPLTKETAPEQNEEYWWL